jgi:hypothetical protein
LRKRNAQLQAANKRLLKEVSKQKEVNKEMKQANKTLKEQVKLLTALRETTQVEEIESRI